MNNLKHIADTADLIVDGYAFSRFELGYRVLNLNNPEKSLVISTEGETLETTMDDIEINIVESIYQKDKKYLEN